MDEREFHDHHYEADAARILGSPLFAAVHERAARQFLRSTGAGRQHRLLSLGCGDGAIELRLAGELGEIVGLDISGVAIGQARERARAAGIGNATFVEADLTTLSTGKLGQFDFVAAFAFLHHLPDEAIEGVLRAARGALRPGGAFYSSDPSARRLVRLFAGLVRATYDRYHSPDERELDPGRLHALAGAAGLKSARLGYVDYFLGPLAWLAPRAPHWTVPPLAALDGLLLSVPGLNRYSSSFSLLARA